MCFQKNKMTSWIDGSFVYSTTEPWANSMRTFENGSLKMVGGKFPPYNTEGVPLYNDPLPHTLSNKSPERMFVLGDPRYYIQS